MELFAWENVDYWAVLMAALPSFILGPPNGATDASPWADTLAPSIRH